MGRAKDLRVAPIAAAEANAAVSRWHYSGSFVRNSRLHLGVFLAGRLEGAMQFGPSLDQRKLIGLVRDTPWNGFIELNRMAFSETLLRNSESRALGVALRLLRKAYPHLGWVVSFADATQCGDGTIYRAAGFVLTGIKRNTGIWRLADGGTVNKTTMTHGPHMVDGAASMKHLRDGGARPLEGFQLRYLYFLDPAARERLTAPPIPFTRIAELGAGMHRGERYSRAPGGAGGDPPPAGGSSPTRTLPRSDV